MNLNQPMKVAWKRTRINKFKSTNVSWMETNLGDKTFLKRVLLPSAPWPVQRPWRWLRWALLSHRTQTVLPEKNCSKVKFKDKITKIEGKKSNLLISKLVQPKLPLPLPSTTFMKGTLCLFIRHFSKLDTIWNCNLFLSSTCFWRKVITIVSNWSAMINKLWANPFYS